MIKQRCRICGNEINNRFFIAKEMMFGLRDEFDYMECDSCGCLQIRNIPADISRYYPQNYYSYSQQSPLSANPTLVNILKGFLMRQLVNYRMGQFSPIGKLLASKYKHYHYSWIKKGMVRRQSKILDVGCGSGQLLLNLRAFGFMNLSGIDPYVHDDIHYDNGVAIKKKFLHEVTETYDFIMMHHSFEHMDDPAHVFQSINRLLNHGCYALIRIPVADSYAWRKYGVNWIQLDAPRHYYLHTTASIQALAVNADLILKDVMYDSSSFQFIGSEKYLRNIAWHDEIDFLTKDEILAFSKEAIRLNSINDGDSACFYLYKR